MARSLSTIGSLAVNVVAQTGKFNKDIAIARTSVDKFAKGVHSSLKVMTKYTAAVTAVGVATGTVLGKQQLLAVDSIGKISDKLGITTEGLTALRYAAGKTGVASNTLDMALQRMTRRLSEAALGGGEAVGALKDLRLNAAHLAVLAPDKAFGKIAGAMKLVKHQSDRVRLSFKLFDSEGVALVNTLKLGAHGLNVARLEAERFGLTVSRDVVLGVEKANDAFFKLKSVATGCVSADHSSDGTAPRNVGQLGC